jgi:hypothetical protein
MWGSLVLGLWRKIRRTGRVAEPAPDRPRGPQPDGALALGGSVQIRHVDAGSCNGCEVEIGSAFGPVWPALPVALADTIVPDFPLTNKSFNLSYTGNDL